MKIKPAVPVASLPFTAPGSLWIVDPSLAPSAARRAGQAYAALYLKHMRDRDEPLLGDIVGSMIRSGGGNPSCVAGFCDVIDQHLRATIDSPAVTALFQY